MKELIIIILIYLCSSFHICTWEDCTHNFEYKSDNSGYPGLIKSTQEKENKWIEENL